MMFQLDGYCNHKVTGLILVFGNFFPFIVGVYFLFICEVCIRTHCVRGLLNIVMREIVETDYVIHCTCTNNPPQWGRSKKRKNRSVMKGLYKK